MLPVWMRGSGRPELLRNSVPDHQLNIPYNFVLSVKLWSTRIMGWLYLYRPPVVAMKLFLKPG